MTGLKVEVWAGRMWLIKRKDDNAAIGVRLVLCGAFSLGLFESRRQAYSVAADVNASGVPCSVVPVDVQITPRARRKAVAK